ncbi:MAG: hypothetical protein JWN30_2698 [Bacilli bacterium]|nr:hypothetical protein [Bacilli bacterium]
MVYELYTNGTQYKTQLSAIQQTDDALAKSSAVMDQLSSVEMSVYQQGPKDVEIDATLDANQKPPAAHLKITVTVGSNAYGTPTTFEFYHQNGIDYTLDPKTNQWNKKTVGDPSSDSATHSHFASPYLTLTDNTDSYVLTGTFDQKALKQQLSNSR